MSLSLKTLVLALTVSLLAVPVLAQENTASTTQQIAELTALVQKLQARVEALEGKLKTADESTATAPTQSAAVRPAPIAPASAAERQSVLSEPAPDSGILRGTTVNLLLDGYYGFNFNSPIGRANLLRSYDVSSNAFSLGQADLVLENVPDLEHGKRFGLRLDLQYGQATATLQGNANNEPRPDVYRNIFQAYGTYVAPIGHGLTIDFGKWASSLGMEGNYNQDQINYSRSLWFDFLPFYHMGARVSYKVSDLLTLNYWVTNGTQQTEPFNGYKDELFGVSLQPRQNIAWTINYYLGQEHADFQYVPGSTQAGLPSLQGIPFQPIVDPPSGKLHIFDSYANWAATPKLTLAAEGDTVIERLLVTSVPSRTTGGAGYIRYQLTPKLAIAGRGEWMFDHGGQFTGSTNSLHEATVTFEQKVYNGFLVREEFRRDFSNHPYFLSDTLGLLKKDQTTATIGLIWWFGAKKGTW